MRPKSLMAIALSTAAILASCLSHAQDAASAKALLASAYSHYGKDGKGVRFSKRYFHSSLLALIDADIKANGTDNVPAVDFDPVCGCQDWEGIWDLEIVVAMETPQRAHAKVTFSLAPPKNRPEDAFRKLQMTLVPERGQWRIYDILDESDPKMNLALRNLIEEDLATLRRNSLRQTSP
jgi:Protein of unknown function (DUF3828)